MVITVVHNNMPDPYRRDQIHNLAEAMRDAITSGEINEVDVTAGVVHHFSKGVNAREMTIKAGHIIVGKIHKTAHLNIISKGDITVTTQFGTNRYQAPFTFVSAVGTQRAVFAHSDTVWTTIHPTTETDIEKIENEIIAKSYDELPNLYGPCLPKESVL